MCEECRHYPCISSCPNAPEPEPVYICDECDEGIYPGETVYEIDGKYLQKLYKGSGAGNGDFTVESFKGNPRVTLKKKVISYQLTWNKAAKLIHGYLHKEEKRNV